MARKYKSRMTTDKLDLKIEQQKDALEKAKAKYEAEKEALADNFSSYGQHFTATNRTKFVLIG